MTLLPFSQKQLQALCWWCRGSPVREKDAVICDGAVRSGKTLCMGISFVAWAFYTFQDAAFALCGKTIRSLKRNLLLPLLPVLGELGFDCRIKNGENLLEITQEGRKNRFYLFGGKDESSAALIQGMTLAGVLFDEVALMPRSFVEQALARCSVEGSKFWFNCNPEHPQHWFYLEWIKQAARKTRCTSISAWRTIPPFLRRCWSGTAAFTREPFTSVLWRGNGRRPRGWSIPL